MSFQSKKNLFYFNSELGGCRRSNWQVWLAALLVFLSAAGMSTKKERKEEGNDTQLAFLHMVCSAQLAYRYVFQTPMDMYPAYLETDCCSEHTEMSILELKTYTAKRGVGEKIAARGNCW